MKTILTCRRCGKSRDDKHIPSPYLCRRALMRIVPPLPTFPPQPCLSLRRNPMSLLDDIDDLTDEELTEAVCLAFSADAIHRKLLAEGKNVSIEEVISWLIGDDGEAKYDAVKRTTDVLM